MMYHGAPDRLSVCWCREFCGDAASGHDADAIGKAEDLVEIVAHQHNGGPASPRLQQPLMDGSTGANVRPRLGLCAMMTFG